MKLVKSLLLGSAAGLVAVAGAQAADLPSRKAAPAADYVRICSAYGAGFYYIPGTETCLRVGGRVRAEYQVTSRASSLFNAYGFRARGRLNLDARTQTAYGVVRTYVRLEGTWNTGQYNSAVDTGPASAQVFNLDLAFIQFAGITAGRSLSFFDIYGYAVNYAPLRGTQGDNIPLLAYTATFGGGFSATLSLEDGSFRARNVAGVRLGREYPDLVGNIRIAQGWGSAQLSAAVHQVRGANNLAGAASYNKTGFAIGAGAAINLPSLAPGDVFHIEAVYAEGATSYLGVGNTVFADTIGAVAWNAGDAYFANGVAGNPVRLAKGFSLVANLTHYWTPSFRQNIFGSYLNLDYRGRAGAVVGGDFSRIEEYRVGTALIWSPTSGFDIGVEVLYANIQGRGFTGAGVRYKGEADSFQGRLRLQRDF